MTVEAEQDQDEMVAAADVAKCQAAYDCALADYGHARLQARVAVKANAEQLAGVLAIARAAWVLEWHRLHVANLRLDRLICPPSR
jgi:virulence-associated protein VapD